MSSKKIIIIDWTHCIEDFLENIGLSFEDFTTKMTGGWLFGYIEAFKKVNTRSVFFCFSKEYKTASSFLHVPTGATIVVIPLPGMYKIIRKYISNPYTANATEAAGVFYGIKKIAVSFLLKIAPYCSTPFFSLRREIKKQGCDAILCQEYENPRFDICVLLGRSTGIPVFATFQGGNWQLSPFEKYFRKTILKKSAGLVIATQSEIKRVKAKYGIPAGKISRIFNPVDLSLIENCSREEARKRLSLPENLRIAIWHGRIDYFRKGLDLLLAAWDLLNKEEPGNSFHLILIGSGTNDDDLNKALHIRSHANITWINEYINERKIIYTYLMAADVYVFPSRREGFPVAPLEAMACCLPLIATDAPGIPDLLAEGEQNGGVMIKRDDKKALAEQLQLFLKNPAYSKKLGLNARQHIEKNFSLHSVGQQLFQFVLNK